MAPTAERGGIIGKKRRPPPDPAPRGQRDRLRATLERAWGEPVPLVYLGRGAALRLRFEVPGLRADGSVVGQGSLRHAVAVATRVLLVGLSAVFVLIWFAVQVVLNTLVGGTDADLGAPRRRRITVHAGDRRAAVVAAGQALRRRRGRLWLACAAHQAAVVACSGEQSTPLWGTPVHGQPTLGRDGFTLHWSDGSKLVTEPLAPERRRYRALRGG